MSGSESSNMKINYNNMLVVNEEALGKIGYLANNFEKITKLDNLHKFMQIQSMIDEQLKKISVMERSLSSSDKMKKRVK